MRVKSLNTKYGVTNAVHHISLVLDALLNHLDLKLCPVIDDKTNEVVKYNLETNIIEKKKVKKWRWVIENCGFLEITEGHYSNEQEVKNVKRGHSSIRVIQKIDSTEIEVEE